LLEQSLVEPDSDTARGATVGCQVAITQAESGAIGSVEGHSTRAISSSMDFVSPVCKRPSSGRRSLREFVPQHLCASVRNEGTANGGAGPKQPGMRNQAMTNPKADFDFCGSTHPAMRQW
jgi:hypothetical protein